MFSKYITYASCCRGSLVSLHEKELIYTLSNSWVAGTTYSEPIPGHSLVRRGGLEMADHVRLQNRAFSLVTRKKFPFGLHVNLYAFVSISGPLFRILEYWTHLLCFPGKFVCPGVHCSFHSFVLSDARVLSIFTLTWNDIILVITGTFLGNFLTTKWQISFWEFFLKKTVLYVKSILRIPPKDVESNA